MSQTTVQERLDVAKQGMLADASGGLYDKFSAHNENESDDDYPNIPFGVMVAKGTTEGGALSLAAQADELLGVSVYSDNYLVGVDVSDIGDLLPGAQFSALQRGRIWVYLEENVDAGDPVRYRAVATTTEVPGAFRTSDPGGTDTVLITAGARYLVGGLSGELALLEIDMLNVAVTADS